MTSQKQYYKNARIDEEKVAACPDVNSPNDMEEGVSEKKMTITKDFMGKKRQNAQMSLLMMIRRMV